MNPPHRIRTVLEGESLLNDATALVIYKLAVSAVAVGSFSVAGAVPTFLLTLLGSVVLGRSLAWLVGLLLEQIEDAPTSVIFQFVLTFGGWLVAEHLGLSAVVTIVVFGLTAGRRSSLPARLWVPTFAIWESVTFVLNVVAFTLIGLQLRPVLDSFATGERLRMVGAALVILAVVIAIRLLWAGLYTLTQPRRETAATEPSDQAPLSFRSGLVIGWSGMRGIVTLAAALALPANFPARDFIQLTAFVVVLGTWSCRG